MQNMLLINKVAQERVMEQNLESIRQKKSIQSWSGATNRGKRHKFMFLQGSGVDLKPRHGLAK